MYRSPLWRLNQIPTEEEEERVHALKLLIVVSVNLSHHFKQNSNPIRTLFPVSQFVALRKKTVFVASVQYFSFNKQQVFYDSVGHVYKASWTALNPVVLVRCRLKNHKNASSWADLRQFWCSC